MSQDHFIPTRESLLSRLKDWDDQESWREFFDTYGRLIHGVARKAGLHEDEAQDVVQETILSVAKAMPGFRYDPAQGSFRGWLFQLTRWRIVNQFRKRQPQSAPPPDPGSSRGCPTPTIAPIRPEQVTPSDGEPAAASLAVAMDDIPDPAGLKLEALWSEEWEGHLLARALVRVKRQVSPSQFQMFDLHVNKRMPVTEVARALGVSAAQIYLAKHRVGRLLQRAVKKAESEIL